MHVRWMAVASVAGLLLMGPAGDLAWAQSPPLGYFAVTPCRLLDTRQGGPALASGASRLVTATGGICGIPTTARAIAVNITSVGSTGGGNLKLYPGDGTAPPTSALNFATGQTRANNGVYPLAGNGNGSLAILATVTGSGTVHVVVDVTGYFAAAPACATPSSCPGVDTECQSRTCTAGVCGMSFQPAGTTTATQVAGDCKVNVCNGVGGITAAIDDSDPLNDGNECTNDVCTAGTPSNPNSPAGSACNQNGGTQCNGAGSCVPACVDIDGDGWTQCDGDCDDNNPNVNPGAFEVPGNGIDDNCSGTVDEAAAVCDGGLASNSTDPFDYARAIDLCQTTTLSPTLPNKIWGVITSQLQLADGTGTPNPQSRSIRMDFGSGNSPGAGSAFAILSTGAAAARNQTNPSWSSFQTGQDMGTTSPFPPDWYAANGNVLPSAPGCPGPADPSAQDPVMLKVRIRVPTNAKSFSVSAKFFSSEFPEWVCNSFNDFFVVLLNSAFNGVPANPSDRNIAKYTTPGNDVYPVGVNLAYGNTGAFTECVNGLTGCASGGVTGNITTCTGTGGLVGTGFDIADSGNCAANSLVGGGTAWLTVKGNVVPGETIDLRFAIWDTSDHKFDSLVLLDNFKWSTQTVTPGAFLGN